MFAFSAPGMGLWQLPSARTAYRLLYGQEKPGWKGAWRGGNNDGFIFFFFLHSFLPVDKYQPTEVLKADIELVAPADLPPIRGMDIICGRRGQTASAPWCQHPAPPQPSPLKGGIEEPV